MMLMALLPTVLPATRGRFPRPNRPATLDIKRFIYQPAGAIKTDGVKK